MANIVGTSSSEFISGTGDDDQIQGGLGNDTVDGLRGDDVIYGQDGNDELNGDQGSDTIFGGSGNDFITGDIAPVPGDNQSTTVSGTLVNEAPVSSTLTGPILSGEATGRFVGVIGQTVPTREINLSYVVDVSGSMIDPAGGTAVGDVNGDGTSNTRLDVAIRAFERLTSEVIAAGFPGATINLVSFSDAATSIGTFTATQDLNGNGVADVIDALRALRASGNTNYEAGLQAATPFFQAQPSGESNYMYFLSDGFPNVGGTVADELLTLNGLGVVRNAFGIGAGSSLLDLNAISSDGSAEVVLNPDLLDAALIGSPVSATAVTDVKLFVNGVLVRTIAGSALVSTPFGLTYDVNLPLAVGADDVVQSLVTFADGTTLTTNLSVSDTFAGDDILDGGSGNDTIDGGGGDDVLRGGSNNDELLGGSGNDSLFGGSFDDLLEGGQGDDLVDGGSGVDTASYEASTVGVNADLETGIARAGRAGDGFDRLVSIENLIGSALSDSLFGDAGNNVLSGGGEADRLEGRDGNDTLLGGTGNDQLVAGNGFDELAGGGGNDRFFVAGGAAPGVNGGRVVIEDTAGIDTIDATGATGPANINLTTGGTVAGRQIVIQAGGTTISPLDVVFSQDLTGSFGDDLPNVVAQLPTVISTVQAAQPAARFGVTSFKDKPLSPFGAATDYTYRTDLALTSDTALLSPVYAGYVADGGADTPESQLEALLQLSLRTTEVGWSSNARRVVVMFTDAVFHVAADAPTLPPNNLDTVLDGTPPGSGESYPTVAAVRSALLAADILPIFAVTSGVRASYDTLVTDLGVGAVVDLAADSSNLSAAITAAISIVTARTEIENLVGTEFDDVLTGNALVNTIFGGGGNDTIRGLEGADFLIGGAGNDTYLVTTGDVITEDATVAGGNDIVRAETSYVLNAGAAVETMQFNVFAGTDNFNLTGNDLVQRISGNNGNNTLSGLGGADTMFGFDGNDFMIGGAGADSMTGGAGDDSYIGVEQIDTIVEVAGGGNDQIRVVESYSLAAGVSIEVLQFNNFAGVDNFNLTGNDVAQTVWGNNGNNFLSGLGAADVLRAQGGADTLLGGAGNDTLEGGAGADQFRFMGPADGTDRIGDFVSGVDRIAISAAGFGAGLVGGAALPGAQFIANATGFTTVDQRFWYDTGTDRLVFDSNGSTAGGVVHVVADFSPTPSLVLAASDIFII